METLNEPEFPGPSAFLPTLEVIAVHCQRTLPAKWLFAAAILGMNHDQGVVFVE